MNFREYKNWIGENAIAKAEWEQMCVSGKWLQLLEADYAIFQFVERRSIFGAIYQTRKEDLIISIMCKSKMTQKEIDEIDFICERPTDGWNVLMKKKIHDEPFNAHVYATADGVMDNGGSGDGYSRLMSPDIDLPSMDAIFYDE
uniref:Uncharacterized protein n=1 Tax=Pithovirus LCPAC404 TaxID=2506597 RepID=A0A481ZBS1_9VIRU|nr:MAG: hypothetical protein LCPAC404_00680 [Pithovirus LCPAC404]